MPRNKTSLLVAVGIVAAGVVVYAIYSTRSPQPQPTASSPAPVGETRSVNLAAPSEEFPDAIWKVRDNADVVAADVRAPDGQGKGMKLVETAGNGLHRIEREIRDLTPGETYTLSLYVRPNERKALTLEMRDFDSKKYGVARFNLATQSVVASKGDIVDAGVEPAADGWCRVWAAVPVGTDVGVFNIQLMDADNATVYSGRDGAGLYLWGIQFERGRKPNPYQPAR